MFVIFILGLPLVNPTYAQHRPNRIVCPTFVVVLQYCGITLVHLIHSYWLRAARPRRRIPPL